MRTVPAALPAVRRLRVAELDSVRAIMEASLAVDDLPGHTSADIDRAIARIPLDPDGTALALDGETVVGYCTPRLDDLTVHPDHRRRGHGRRLVAEGRAIVAERGFAHLQLHGPQHLPATRAFIDALGFRYHSSLWRFELDPAVSVPEASFPPDVAVRELAPDEDLDAFVALLNDSFADHPTPLSWTVDVIRHVNGLPDFDPTGIRIVTSAGRPGDLIGFARAEVRRDHAGVVEGSIGLIGVRAEWRGRGLGRELLRWAIGHLRGRGAGLVHLSVEALNETATRIYRAAGFVPTIEWPHYVLPSAVLDPANRKRRPSSD
jgi:mycothiol synthase